MESSLLEVVCCPVTHQPLFFADANMLEDLNGKIAAGVVKSAGGKSITAPLKEVLMREDGKVLYPICDGIPVLLADEGIAL